MRRNALSARPASADVGVQAALVHPFRDVGEVVVEQVGVGVERHRRGGELDPTRMAMGMGEQRILIGDTVHTRRNDPQTGVENRALWVVSSIREHTITLASASDSGELRQVTTDYALEHLQLAYASTVHGIQGETVDASFVGPDMDAAGLYVGLTGGRLHNEVVAVASTDHAAQTKVAASMMRGGTELTMHDAVRAAQASCGVRRSRGPRSGVQHRSSRPTRRSGCLGSQRTMARYRDVSPRPLRS